MIDSINKISVDIALKESKARIESIFRSAPIGIGVVSNRIIVEVNDRFCEMTRYKKTELIGQNSRIVYSNDEEFERIGKYKYEQIKKFGTGSLETQFKRKDGKIIDILLSSTPIDLNDISKGVTFTALDITERKQADIMISESEERFRSLYENATIGLYRTTPSGQIMLANPTLINMLGYSSFDELKNRDLEKAGYAPSYKRKTFIEQVEKYGIVKGLEAAWVRKGGSTIYIRESGHAVRDTNGKTLYYDGTVEDITESKQSEEVLREKIDMMSAIVSTTQEWIWEINLQGIHTYSNPTIEQILGYPPDKLVGNSSFDLMHEDDRQMIATKLPKWISDKRGWKNLEIRWRHKDGSWRYLESNGVPIIDDDGEITGFRGVDRDITERKQTDEKLISLSLIVEQSKEGIAQADLEGFIFYANQAWCEMHGYKSQNECLGQNLKIFHSKEQLQNEVTPFNEKVMKYGTYSGEVGHITLDGKPFPTFMTSTLIKDNTGNPYAIAGIARDITENKIVEETLAKYRDNLEELVKERTAEIEEKNFNLQRFHDATINREFRIKDLKDEIDKLKSELNR